MGFLPFIPGDILKIALAATIYHRRPNLLASP
jgi:biotin transporter BioY